MMKSLRDKYYLIAQLYPGTLSILPILLSCYVLIPTKLNELRWIISIFLAAGGVYATGQFARSRGRSLERALFLSWGGMPSVAWLRHCDNNIDIDTKFRYHEFLANNISGWLAPTRELEETDRNAADSLYESACRWLREYTRDKSKFSLIYIENISYGFRRNCLGIKYYAMFIIFISMKFILLYYYYHFTNIIDHYTILIAIFINLMFLVFWCFVVNINWVKESADSYARALLAACEKVMKNPGRTTKPKTKKVAST